MTSIHQTMKSHWNWDWNIHSYHANLNILHEIPCYISITSEYCCTVCIFMTMMSLMLLDKISCEQQTKPTKNLFPITAHVFFYIIPVKSPMKKPFSYPCLSCLKFLHLQLHLHLHSLLHQYIQ